MGTGVYIEPLSVSYIVITGDDTYIGMEAQCCISTESREKFSFPGRIQSRGVRRSIERSASSAGNFACPTRKRGPALADYIDGFVLPIPHDRLDEYRRLVLAIAEIWKEHGALDYREYVSDDLTFEGTRSFTDLTAASEGEVIVFGWVVFESREARDSANEKVAADPRVADLVSSSNSGFDAQRMAYGGFQSLVPSDNTDVEC